MRLAPVAAALVALAACSPEIPDSGAAANSGVGFGSYQDYLAQRAAQAQPAQSGALVPGGQISQETVAYGQPPQLGTPPSVAAPAVGAPADPASLYSSVAPQAVAPVAATGDATRARGDAPAGIKVESGEVASAISDEQDFSAVSSRESIQSDKQRLEQQRAQYQVIAPTALPERHGSKAPDIVAFALTTTNAVGEQLYSRQEKLSQSQLAVRCGRYDSQDKAQEAFLRSGGPKNDRNGIDPDGDGFACFWDPSPFRAALR